MVRGTSLGVVIVSALGLLGLGVGRALVTPAQAATASTTPASATVDYTRDIQPILSDRCYHCHGPDSAKRKADLRLDRQEGALGIHDGKAAVVPGKPDASELVRRILSSDPDEKMPPPNSHRALSPHEIDLLQQWVAAGAPWAKHWSLMAPQRPVIPAVKHPEWTKNPVDRFILAKLEAEGIEPSPEAPRHTLIRRLTLDLTGLPPTPAEVDAFVKDASPDAYEKVVDRLIASPRYGERMVWEWLDAARYADTNGYQGDNTRTMWPWRDWAIKAFNSNMPFDQFTVEQLAGDLVPAETANDGEDEPDKVRPAKKSGSAKLNSTSPASEAKLATAFCRNYMINGEGGRIPEENRIDYVMDQTETLSTVWLGLTLGCSRCHDHKFDPFTQKEYYQLFAFFNNTPVKGGGGSGQTAPVIAFDTPKQRAELAELEKTLKKVGSEVATMEEDVFPHEEGEKLSDSPAAADLSGNVVKTLGVPPLQRKADPLREMVGFFKDRNPTYGDALARLKLAVEKRDAFDGGIPRVMVMEEMPKPRDTFILVKGAYDKPTDKVTAGTPAALPPLPDGAKADRLALAQWLMSPAHPLTARVAVNRYWQQIFGVGLVKTSDDFGVQGERPSHPELLDWLAVEFRDPATGVAEASADGVERAGGRNVAPWNVKGLIRLLVTSATYRQSSKLTPDSHERDPENRLLARGARYRMPAFMLRDQALAASGLLVEKLGGPPVKPYQPAGIWEEATFGKAKYEQDHGDALYRRSVYTFWRRIVGPTEFFDSAARQVCTVKISRTNTPLQALTLLNDPTFVEAARALAQQVILQSSDPQQRLDSVYRRVLARKPSAPESQALLQSLEKLTAYYAASSAEADRLLAVGESKRDASLNAVDHAAWTGVCLAVLNFDEAMSKE